MQISFKSWKVEFWFNKNYLVAFLTKIAKFNWTKLVSRLCDWKSIRNIPFQTFQIAKLQSRRHGGGGGGIPRPCPPSRITACAPPSNENCSSKKQGLSPKESNRFGTIGVPLECSWSQEVFFRRFCNINPFWGSFTPKLVEIRTFSEY